MRPDLQEPADDANVRAARLADEAGLLCSVSAQFGFLPVRLVPRAHPHDAATRTATVVHHWRDRAGKRRAAVVPDHLEVDPDLYSQLDGRARDALLAVELTVAEFNYREARSAAAMQARRTQAGTGCASWDQALERSSTGRPAMGFFAVLAIAAIAAGVSACVPAPGAGIVALLGGVVIVGAMVWAVEAAFRRSEHRKADKIAARLVGADAVRYMLMSLQASEPHRVGAAAVRRRWWGYRPTVGHRLKSLDREFPSPALSS